MRALAVAVLAAAIHFGLAGFASAGNVTAEQPTVTKIRPFTLKDHRGVAHSLANLKDQKLIVVVFLGAECPLAELYAPRLAKIHADYKKRGVALVGINANSQDSLNDIATYCNTHKLQFPILKDATNKVADHFKAKRTPQAYVLDSELNVRYQGRIDDQYGVGNRRDTANRNDLQVAIDELLAGKEVSQPVTEAEGCYIGKLRKAKAEAPVTYTNQISRLFQKHCIECHRPGQVAPFSLTDYNEIVGWAETIGEVVADERMPPWHADPKHHEFSNDRRLSDDEKKLIQRWVADGAPEGDPKDLPAPQTFAEGWQLPRKPDAVFAMADKPISVQAEGTVDYQYFAVDTNFKEDKWIEAAQVLTGNASVVHHILVAAVPAGTDRIEALVDIRGYLAGYVPGLAPKPYPKGMAKRLPAGSRLVFQVHYSPIGSEQTDLSRIGLVFTDSKELTHEVRTTSALQPALSIPAGASNHRVDAYSPVATTDVLLLSMLPHMHVRGKSFYYEAVYPNGRRESLLRVSRYDHNWQTSYSLKEPKKLSRGTRIHCTARFDNSERNANNPDPGDTVKWGSQASDEMMIGYFDVAIPLAAR